eukprot:m.174171 g.174171  ORF g.174171 m.174171 type:complete len:789 (-) comp16537_c0_seq2:419-2785(-)
MTSRERSFWDVRIELRISEAKNITAKEANGTSDPYCVVEVDDEEVARTSTKWRTLDPFFGESFHIALPHNFSIMSIKLFDQEKLGKDDKLGMMVFNRSELFNTINGGVKERWFPLLKPVPAIEVQGEVFVELLLTPTSTGLKRLDLTVVKARDLFPRTHTAKCEPYFVVNFDEETRTSTGKQLSRCPLWDESFVFERASMPQTLAITILDGTKKASTGFLGQALIDLTQLESGLRHLQWHRLAPRMEDYEGNTSGNGTIRVFAQLTHQLIMPESAYHQLFSYLLANIDRPDTAISGWLGLLQTLLNETGKGSTGERDELASALMLAFKSEDAVKCLRALTSHQIATAENSATLFRSNTLASKCADYFMKIIGMNYLHKTLKEIVDDIFHEKKDCEIDPSKMSHSSSGVVKKHAAELIRYLERILDRIFSSASSCPRPMRLVFDNIRNAVEENVALSQTPEGQPTTAAYTAVSGFIFLRFFAPAVLSPKLFGMREELADVTTARTLTLLAKALQAIGNLGSSDISLKEEYMAPLGPVIDRNVPRAKKFIEELCRVDAPAAGLEDSDHREDMQNEVAISAKLFVLEPGSKSFKKKIVSLTRHELRWQKSPTDHVTKINITDIINVEQMEQRTFDKKYPVQVITDESTVVLSFSTAQDMNSWLKLFREFLRGGGAFIRSACHSGVFKKHKWTCCGQDTEDAAPCSKAHTAVALNSFSLALSESERMHSLYAILVGLLPKLQELEAEHAQDRSWKFKDAASSLIEILRMLEIQHLLLQKPLPDGDGITAVKR